jgi:hypothetical protein
MSMEHVIVTLLGMVFILIEEDALLEEEKEILIDS